MLALILVHGQVRMNFSALFELIRAVFQLELCLVSMTPTCPLLIRDCCFSMIKFMRTFLLRGTSHESCVGSELNTSIFFSESRKKHLIVWMVGFSLEGWGFFCLFCFFT